MQRIAGISPALVPVIGTGRTCRHDSGQSDSKDHPWRISRHKGNLGQRELKAKAPGR